MFEQRIVAVVERYLSLDGGEQAEFAQCFADVYFDVRRNSYASAEDHGLCNLIVGPLAEFSRGGRSQKSFLVALENTIRPFVPELASGSSAISVVKKDYINMAIGSSRTVVLRKYQASDRQVAFTSLKVGAAAAVIA